MRNRALACLLLLPLLAACGGGSEDEDDPTLVAQTTTPATPATATEEPDFTEGANAPDPCSLLTVAEVSAAVGAQVEAGKKSSSGPPIAGESCIWSTATVPLRTFQVALTDGGDITVDGLDPAGLYEQSVKQFEVTDTPGIGDRAAFGASQAFVLKGDVLLTTSTGFGTSETAQAALRTLTTKAAAGL